MIMKAVVALLLCCSLSAVYASSTTKSVVCNQAMDCTSCLQADCDWCPRTNYCYKTESIFNECKKNQNIPSTEMCPISAGNYDNKLATRLAVMSSLAYLSPKSKDLGDAQDYINIRKDGDLHVHDYKINTFYEEGDTAVVLVTSSVEKSIIVAFRGTISNKQLFQQAACSSVMKSTPIGGKANAYFVNTHRKLYACFGDRLKTLLQQNPDYQVHVTGHSLGGALATMHAGFLVANSTVAESRVSLYTFGAPRVGNVDFAIRLNALISKAWRITKDRDPVPHLPFETLSYTHSAREVFYPSNVRENVSPKICNLIEESTCAAGRLDLSSDGASVHHSSYFFDHLSNLVSCQCADEGTEFTTANGCNVYDGTQLLLRKRKDISKRQLATCIKYAFLKYIDDNICNGQIRSAQWSLGILSISLFFNVFLKITANPDM